MSSSNRYILICAPKSDTHAQAVCREIERRSSHTPLILELDLYPSQMTNWLITHQDGGHKFVLFDNSHELDQRTVHSIWWP